MLSAHAASSESSRTSCRTVPQPGPQPWGGKLLELGVSTGSGPGSRAWRWLPWTTPWGGDWVGLGLGPARDRGWLSTGRGQLSGAVPWGQQSTKESRPQGSQGPEECWARQSRARPPGALCPAPAPRSTVARP